MNPPLTVIVSLYEPDEDVEHTRRAAAKQALTSWSRLHYDGELRIHLADDGSNAPSYLDEICQHVWSPFATLTTSTQRRKGVGASINAGIRQVTMESGCNLFAYFADDWILDRDLDITPWVAMLDNEESVGMVRLGPPHPDLTGTIRHTPYGWCMNLDRHHYAFALRPALYHMRLFEYCGPFPENVSSWECERLYNDAWSRFVSPEIVLALPDFWHPLYPYAVGELVPADV